MKGTARVQTMIISNLLGCTLASPVLTSGILRLKLVCVCQILEDSTL